MIVFLKMDLSVMKSGKSLVTGGTGVGLEPGVNILMYSPLNICLERLGAEVTEVFLDGVGSLDVICQLYLALSAVRTHLGSLGLVSLMHSPHMSLEIVDTGECLVTDVTCGSV